jgi:hypothetical protein
MARQLLEAALALLKEERADLAEQLLASVEDDVTDADMFGDHEPDPEIEKASAAEITMIDPNDFARRARGRPAPSPLATAIG